MKPLTLPAARRSLCRTGWLALLWLAALPVIAAERPPGSRVSNETTAVIVVTGMRLDENPDHPVQDRAVAEGAVVVVTQRGGAARTKTTKPFAPGTGAKARAGYFTADFTVELDAIYEIALTFKDGTTIRVDDFRLPKEWRTHFYFHNTRGTLSPASILRTATLAGTDRRLQIYAVFPLANYRALGGTAEP